MGCIDTRFRQSSQPLAPRPGYAGAKIEVGKGSLPRLSWTSRCIRLREPVKCLTVTSLRWLRPDLLFCSAFVSTRQAAGSPRLSLATATVQMLDYSRALLDIEYALKVTMC